jgi:site-specific DNA-adenine methylase
MKSLKTPLRYPGGKSRACVKLAQYLPDMKQYTEFREPFLGGGSVALYMTKQYPHLDIWVNDLYGPLYNFWKELQHNGQAIAEQLKQYKIDNPTPDTAKNLFLESKEIVNEDSVSNLLRACSFYVINKCSFSGLTESSSFSRQASDSNFSMRGIEKLPDYSLMIKDWKITNLSYEYLLSDNKQTFTYLDPPYEIGSNLYGKRGNMHSKFNHDHFAIKCDRFVGPQLISYNSSQLIRERFKEWQAAEFSHTYTMRSVGDYMKDQHERKELVLFNYDRTNSLTDSLFNQSVEEASV